MKSKRIMLVVCLILAAVIRIGAITIIANYGEGFGPGTPQRAVFDDKIARWLTMIACVTTR